MNRERLFKAKNIYKDRNVLTMDYPLKLEFLAYLKNYIYTFK